MREEYDLSDATVHPLAGKFKGKFTAIVHYDLNDKDKQNEVSQYEPEMVVTEATKNYINK